MSGEPPDESPWLIDFFEEGETHENAPREEPVEEASVRVGGHRARAARMRGTSSAGQARARQLLLLVIVVLAIATASILALSGGSEAAAETSYLNALVTPAQDSQQVGIALSQLLTAPPSSVSTLTKSLDGLVARQRGVLREVTALNPPPRLRAEQQQAVSAMQFRVDGLSGLLTGFTEAAAHPTGVNWASQLSIQAERLIASDVIWSVFFASPTNAQAARDGARTDHAPASVFVADADITSPESMASVLASVEGHAASTTPQTGLLALNDHGAAVTAWQKQLNRWIARQSGMTKLKVTGVFDQATQAATISFQNAAQISADGVVGSQTRAALTAALAKSG